LLNVADSSVVSVDGKLATGTAKDLAGSTVAAATNDYVALVSLPVKTKILPAKH